MQNIYQVENSYHLMEGLDSEFLVIASSEEQAKDVCLRLLAEDQDSHIETIKENLKNLIKSQEKQWALMEQDEEKAMFFKRRTKILIYYQTLARLTLKIGFVVYF